MKKTIAQAKVCVIGKLVKKLRDAKKQLESADVKPLKLSTRPAKLTEQIDYLKRAGNVELATKCLVDIRNAQQLLTNPLASNADIAWAHLSSFKTVVTRVAQIKAKYGLDDTDVDWRTAIAETGKKKQKKNVKEAHLKRKAEQKERANKDKAAEQKRSEWLEENADDASGPDRKEPATDASNDDDDDEAVQSDIADDASDSDNMSGLENATESETQVREIQSKRKTSKKQPTVKKTAASTVKANVSAKTKLASATAKPNITKPTVKVTATVERPPPVAPKRHLDSFFVTSGGSAYMSTGFEARQQPVGPNDGMDRRERRAQQFGKVTSRGKTARPAAPHERPQPNGRNDASKYQKPVAVQAAGDIELHPSWAAKQRTKGIASFQGSKKTFGDDDDIANDSRPVANKAHIAPAANSRKLDAPTTDTAEKLHPSWLAKQKLKPVISAFQGKKITFD